MCGPNPGDLNLLKRIRIMLTFIACQRSGSKSIPIFVYRLLLNWVGAGLMLLVTTQMAFAESAEKGREQFMKSGCWQCHGTWGQGGAAGLRLAPNPKPLAYISAFIRHSNGPMPPYTEKVLSEEELGDIYAYLQSIPASPEAKTIPLLNNFK